MRALLLLFVLVNPISVHASKKVLKRKCLDASPKFLSQNVAKKVAYESGSLPPPPAKLSGKNAALKAPKRKDASFSNGSDMRAMLEISQAASRLRIFLGMPPLKEDPFLSLFDPEVYMQALYIFENFLHLCLAKHVLIGEKQLRVLTLQHLNFAGSFEAMRRQLMIAALKKIGGLLADPAGSVEDIAAIAIKLPNYMENLVMQPENGKVLGNAIWSGELFKHWQLMGQVPCIEDCYGLARRAIKMPSHQELGISAHYDPEVILQLQTILFYLNGMLRTFYVNDSFLKAHYGETVERCRGSYGKLCVPENRNQFYRLYISTALNQKYEYLHEHHRIGNLLLIVKLIKKAEKIEPERARVVRNHINDGGMREHWIYLESTYYGARVPAEAVSGSSLPASQPSFMQFAKQSIQLSVASNKHPKEAMSSPNTSPPTMLVESPSETVADCSEELVSSGLSPASAATVKASNPSLVAGSEESSPRNPLEFLKVKQGASSPMEAFAVIVPGRVLVESSLRQPVQPALTLSGRFVASEKLDSQGQAKSLHLHVARLQ